MLSETMKVPMARQKFINYKKVLPTMARPIIKKVINKKILRGHILSPS